MLKNAIAAGSLAAFAIVVPVTVSAQSAGAPATNPGSLSQAYPCPQTSYGQYNNDRCYDDSRFGRDHWRHRRHHWHHGHPYGPHHWHPGHRHPYGPQGHGPQGYGPR
ncbi:hypothetical protein [Sphaerisporangium dianthi]|uniref:Uncharacterized protein n=1 Tax=Sphaerisporangium dianthi TaxID=1436120 RepID=A0ABV9C8I5_9ACTN